MSSRSYGRFVLPVEVLPLALKVAGMSVSEFDGDLNLIGLFEDAGKEPDESSSSVDDFEALEKYATISSHEGGGGYDIALVFEKVGIPYTLDADAGDDGEYPAYIRLSNAAGKVLDRTVDADGRYAVHIETSGENPTYEPKPEEIKAITEHARENARLTDSIMDGTESVSGIAAMYLAWKSEN